MRLEELDYPLPRHLIADAPVDRRDECRLMVLDRATGAIAHHRFRDLPQFLRGGDVVVLNDTRVVPARLVGRRRTGGRWEGLFLREHGPGWWEVLLRGRGRLREGEELRFARSERWALRLRRRCGGGVWLVQVEPPGAALEVLEEVGQVPLPPYIRRTPTAEDRSWYQTVYAVHPGSVAAPTAGLHFTEKLLEEIRCRGVAVVSVTLHVGPGTFRPIQAAELGEHVMHGEWCRVSAEAAERIGRCRARGGRIVAVGTTVVRTLETAARGGTVRPFEGVTDLFIYPPYRFRAVDVLLTNFHLPRSTLLALVYAFGGTQLVRRAYQEAIEQGYRFYSYGDAMLII